MRRLLFIVPILLFIVSCSVKREIVEVPVETIKTEYIHDLKIDSVYMKDSIDRYIRGDTVYVNKTHIQYKYKARIDTVLKVDTIPKIIEKKSIEVVEVNNTTWYQDILMLLGLIPLILFIYIIYKKLR